jgi:hypothetical protein
MSSRRIVMWLLVAVGSGAAVLVGAALLGARRWEIETARVVAALHDHAGGPVAPYAIADLTELPAPVTRYFRRALHPGQRMVVSARITWAGQFNMGQPGRDNWRPFTAVQEFVPGAPGFVWNARIAMFPGIPVYVRDSFVGGRASMRGAIFGLIPVVTADGTPTLASGALQRYLGEAAWLPTALLPRSGVSWTAIDGTRARATIAGAGTTVSLEFRFDAEGHNVSVFAPDRFYDDGKRPAVARGWEARSQSFAEREGMVVAGAAVAEWHLPSGTFAYWRGHPTAIEYRFAK